MPEGLLNFLGGGTMVALVGVAIFFLRYWRRTADRLFAFFSAAFLLLAIGQTVVLYLGTEGDKLPYAYWLRLAAFILIIIGVLEKNLPAKGQSGDHKEE